MLLSFGVCSNCNETCNHKNSNDFQRSTFILYVGRVYENVFSGYRKTDNRNSRYTLSSCSHELINEQQTP